MSESNNHTPRRSKPLKRRNVLEVGSRFGPNMTPMVDVTLVILIFFMASASILGHEWFLRADLPKAQDPDLISSGFSLPTPMLGADLYMSNQQVLVRGIGDEPMTLDATIAQIKSIDPTIADGFILAIRAGDDVPYWAVIRVHDAGTSMMMRVSIR